jgi:hypothetical protein
MIKDSDTTTLISNRDTEPANFVRVFSLHSGAITLPVSPNDILSTKADAGACEYRKRLLRVHYTPEPTNSETEERP